jgi:hypothetical protein
MEVIAKVRAEAARETRKRIRCKARLSGRPDCKKGKSLGKV